MDLEFHFTAKLWRYGGDGGWHFVTVPVTVAEQIRGFFGRKPGFGTIRVRAVIGTTQWQTALFPDKASGSFLLPIKSAVRRKASLLPDTTIAITIFIDVEG